MHRRSFLLQSSGLIVSASFGASVVHAAAPSEDRLGMSTVIFRSRFKQTKPKDVADIKNELSLLEVPQYYRERFGIRNLELWSNHFESLEPAYLKELRARVEAVGSRVANVQVDAEYDLAAVDEAVRERSLKEALRWVDAAAALGSKAVRVNPGRTGGSIDKSIASMKEVNRYCKSKGLPLLIENHFGIEMDPELHLRIRAEAGPQNVYTLPDFGNYPVDTMWSALEKIIPHAYMISAKTVEFNDRMEHVTYDFDRCIEMAERAGFKGIYSVEQWSKEELAVDYEKVADWMIARVRAHI
jgi:sugar phosphate isomerase/epimerase